MARNTPTVQSVERAFSILDLVAAGSTTLADITAQVDLPKSTVARLLSTLETIKAVERDDDGYVVGPRVVEFGGLPGRPRLRRLVEPHLQQLAENLGETIGWAVPAGSAVRNVSQVEGRMPVQVRDYTGLVVPAHIGSNGLAYMATWSSDRVAAYLSGPLEAYTASTVTDPATIRERLATIRSTGWAHVTDEFADGISSVAAAMVDDDGTMLGTIHAHGPTYRFPPAGMADEVGALMARAAAAIVGDLPV